MEILLTKINDKFNEQTITLTTAITKNVMEALDEKMKTLMEENNNLKTKVAKLEYKITFMEREKRKKNLILFGIEEKGKSEPELVDLVKDVIEETGTNLDSHEISNIHRIGAPSDKNRPVIISLTTTWKKHLILKNKKNFPPNVYLKEDFPKDVLEIRKQLQPKVEAERKNGNIAYIKYDKLIVKKLKDSKSEKRKREVTISPKSTTPTQKKPNTNKDTGDIVSNKEVIRPNILNYVARGRSSSTSETSKN